MEFIPNENFNNETIFLITYSFTRSATSVNVICYTKKTFATIIYFATDSIRYKSYVTNLVRERPGACDEFYEYRMLPNK